MNKDLATILEKINNLEMRYGLSRIDQQQRSIFNYIVQCAAKGKPATPQDVLNCKFTSRSSTYRHLTALTDMDVIYQKWDGGYCTYSPAVHFEKFIKDILSLGQSKSWNCSGWSNIILINQPNNKKLLHWSSFYSFKPSNSRRSIRVRRGSACTIKTIS